ncbi:MAG: glycerol-3-phosphate acyltransferase, partial [Candidatus Nanopelagicales bacterium]|nr:glycerol-3-phosphate acyltransferase [Candidatus Nanopelagicales bacterium]
VVGYLIGAINPAVLITRARGVDIRATGSGNPGATNVGRALGPAAGVLVALLDVAKGALPVLLFTWLAGPVAGGWAGLAAVIGHITSPFLRGRGGKGVATTIGVLVASHPLWLIPVLGVAVVVILITREVGLGSAAGAVALIVVALVDHGVWESSLVGVLLGLLILLRHGGNLQRWLRHRRDSFGNADP